MGASIVGNCTSFYALKTKEEPINLLEGILKPILFEKFLVDILLKKTCTLPSEFPLSKHGYSVRLEDT